MIQFIIRNPVECFATFASLLPFFVLIRRGDFNKRREKWFFAYLCVKIGIESVMLYMAYRSINNLAIYNTYILLSYLLLARLSYESIDIKEHKHIVTAGSIVFTLLFILDFIDVGLYRVVKVSATLQCLLMIVYCVLFFYGLIKSLKVINLFTYPLFWIFSGMLIYYSSATFATPVYNYVERLDTPKTLYIVVLIPYVTESLYLIMVGLGLMVESD